MAGRVEFTANTLSPNLKKLPQILDRNFFQIMRFHEPQLQSAARHDAPWRDRSGNARTGLTARAVQPKELVYELYLFHKVKYGIWLEIRWSGKYANIMPTIKWYAPKVKASYNKLLDRLKIGGGVS
jgi:hypothetical protein